MLPFQILYDQGVITGFVWQVTTSCVILVLSSLPAFHVVYVFESISENGQFCKNMFCSTLPPCPETSGSILMPWPSLPSLTGWSPQSPVVTHHSHQRGGRHHLHFRPPTCITDLLEYPGLSTMHHYFYNYPWLTVCPFNQVTLLIEWFTLPVCLRLLWVLLQNMKYTKSRGLQGPNIFVALSCTGFLSDFFAAKYWSYIPVVPIVNTKIITKIISMCFKWTPLQRWAK